MPADNMSRKFIIRWRPLALCGLALLGFALRLYGLNWDQGNSFQPDERQILFHVTTLAWPVSLAQFLNPAQSPFLRLWLFSTLPPGAVGKPALPYLAGVEIVYRSHAGWSCAVGGLR